MHDLDQLTRQFSPGQEPVCLEFCNALPLTLGQPLAYSDLVGWAHAMGLLSGPQAQHLLAQAAAEPATSVAVAAQALALRTAIFRLFASLARSGQADAADLATLNTVLALAAPHQRLVATPTGFDWDWVETTDRLDRPLWSVARSAADLLTCAECARVRECASPTCTWLFIDRSRNRSRRWCDMADCGNRAKAQRHYHRHRAAGATK